MTKDEASRNLEVIRSLMERSVIYRSLSAPAALLGGFLSVAAAGGLYVAYPESVDPVVFALVWLIVLILTTIFNISLLGRKSRSESRPFFSSGMRTTMGLIWPAMAAGGVVGMVWCLTGDPPDVVRCAALWSLCYGLALNATRPFSPKSLRWLGMVFTVFGAAILALAITSNNFSPAGDSAVSSLIMGVSFGGFHLVYALATWMGKNKRG